MKKLLLIIGVFICILSYAQIPTTNLAAEYKFTNGTLRDGIGSNDLTQTGSALTLVDNRANGASKAISLNGDYLQRNAFTNIEHLSISYWIKTTTNVAAIKTIMDHSQRTTDANSQSQYGWYTFLQNGKVGVAANFHYKFTNSGIQEGNNGYASAIGTTNIADGNWHHVAISLHKRIYYWQNTQWLFENTYKVYIDGILEGTVAPYKYSGVGSSILSSNMFPGNAVTIGNIYNGNSGSHYSEIIDDIRFYTNHLLTAAEVTSLYNEAACSDGAGVTAIAQNISRQMDATDNIVISAAEIDNGSYADCDATFSLSIDKTAFSCADIGANVVTLTATEATGAQSSTTATVTILPGVVTQDISVYLDASGNATITPADVDNGSAAICSTSFTYSLDISAFTCSEIGTNTVTLTIDDGNGNIGTGTATVNVIDTLIPTAAAQDIAVQVDAITGVATITPAMVDNGSTDNCGGTLTMTLSKSIFKCEDTGENTVTLTVEDAGGNIATADVTVTVTSVVIDETVTASITSMCPDGTSGSTISIGSSVVGINYTLRNSATNAIVNGPIAGTGSPLDFTTGNLSETTTFNVFAEKSPATTQSALDFDGVNDYVNLGADNRGVTTQVTVAAWLRTSTTGVSQFISGKYDNTLGYYLSIDGNGNVGISGRDGSGAARQSGLSTTSVNDGEWHYVVGTINVNTGDWNIYVNGTLENSTNSGTGTTLANSTNHLLGLNSGLYFGGQLDQVTIWDVALDAAAIQSNMNSCLTGNETNIVGHFVFEDGSGTTLTDQSATAINGTLTNMDGSTDWVQITSPSCGEKLCDYQMSTEITIGDNTPPTAVTQDISVQIDVNIGLANIVAADIDNGSSDNCTGGITLSLSTTEFTCADVGANLVTLTVEDASGNISTADATVTVTSSINDEVVSASDQILCGAGSSTSITTGSSVVGVNYYLKNSANDTVVDGPIAGTGNGLSFNTGTINSLTTFKVTGNMPSSTPHSALDFDGVNDKVVTTYAPPATSELTVELWMYPRAPVYSRVLSNFGGGGTVLAGQIVMDTYSNSLNGRGLRFYVSGAGNVQHYVNVSDVLTLNTWNHVAATFKNGIIKLYVDGVLVGTSTTASFTSLPASADNITIGEDRIQGVNAEYFNGQMDELRIWNIAKTGSELVASMNSCIMGNEAGLDLFYDFNENSGLVTADLVSGKNGTLTNMDAGTDWIASGATLYCSVSCEFEMSQTATIFINPTYNLSETVSVCNGASYTFPDGTTQNNITAQVIHVSNLVTDITACDSVITTTVNISSSYNLTETVSVCNGGSYTFPDGTTENNITSQVIYMSNMQTVGTGCDSIIETTVNINSTYNLTETVYVCNDASYVFPDGTIQNNISAQVVYTSNLQTVVTGCDSTIETTVNVVPFYNLSDTVAVCSGDSYTFPDGTIQSNITSQVIYTSNLQTVETGCDSIIETIVNINPTYLQSESISLCSGESYTFPDGITQANITSPGVYTSNLQTVAAGCDSIIVTSIYVNPSYNLSDSVNICFGESYTFPDGTSQANITSQIMHTNNLQTVNTGCDSIIVTTINVSQPYNQTETISICEGESHTFPDGTTQNNITTQVIYTSNLQTVTAGCDSIIVTTVNVNPKYSNTETVTVCNGDTYTFPDETTQNNITAQIIHTSNLQTAAGCDSIIVTTVNVNTIDASVTQNGSTLTANISGVSYQWVDCNNGNTPIASETNQSFTAKSNGDYTVVITDGTCATASDCFNINTTELKQFYVQNISVYPNPASYELNVEYGNLIIEKMHMIDGRGKMVKAIIPNAKSINIADLSEGIYILQFLTSNDVLYYRFIKE